MNDLSDNPYLIGTDIDWKNFNLNSYVFYQSVPKVDVSIDRFYFLVREMLAYLKFDITLLGYRYLAKLMQYYLVCDNGLNLNSGLTFVSERYGIECSFVKSNIKKAIEVNVSFRALASKMLAINLSDGECGEVESVVLILGAIFKRYYNCNVIGDTETEEDKILLIHKNRILRNG